MGLRGITTFIVLVAIFSLGLLLGVSIFDPLATFASGYNQSAAPNAIGNIHEVMVKYAWVVAIGSALLWAVFWILREERQTVR